MPFKKGDPNINRKGRPLKGFTVADLFKEEGDIVLKDGPFKGLTKRRAMIRKAYDAAIGGDDQNTRLCLEREFGKVMETIEFHEERKPLDLSKYTDRELILLEKLLAKGETDVDHPNTE